MKHFTLVLAWFFCMTLSTAVPAQGLLPKFHVDDLDNGLRLVTMPTAFPDIVCVYVIVATGSRNEVELGKTGFAHFFEHMMFRGSKNYTSAQQAAFFKKIGASRNAYTTDDYTAYHSTFSKEDLEEVLRMEADRFQYLHYEQGPFRTEAMAVFGEYNKNSANPVNKLDEVLSDTAFTTHTYKHTTMGFLPDIVAMPRQYEYSKTFFDRWYRPEYTTLVVVGDVTREATLAHVQKHWGAWQRGSHTVEIPAEPAQTEPRAGHVPWPTPTQPWLALAWKGPAFSVTTKDCATLDVLGELLASENSELYQKLVVQEQKADVLAAQFSDAKDPGLLTVLVRVRDAADLGYARDQVLAALERAKTTPVEASRLRDVQRAMKYGLAARLDSSEGIARLLAGYVARTRSPAALEQVFALYEQVTAADVVAIAKKYFVDERRTTVTLAHGDVALPPEGIAEGKGLVIALDDFGGREPAPKRTDDVLLPSTSPLVSFRIVFKTGSAFDPKGKEGLTHVTARLLANGGTKKRTFEQITRELHPIAGSVGFQVDKEMTTFAGTVHRDNVEAYWGILREMLMEPAFDPADFERAKKDTLSFLEVDLRQANDEELGKEVLYQELYRGTKYEHYSAGTIASVQALTVDDVRACWRSLTGFTTVHDIGLAGGYPADLPRRVAEGMLGADIDVEVAQGDAVAVPVDAKAQTLTTNRLTIVQKPALATGMHIGFPIEVTRKHPDWVALWLVRSWLGEHRSENSHLYQRLRELRGLNYGDYAYIEYFPRGMFQFEPSPNLARQSQIFQIWLRPVPPMNAAFALKGAWHELDKLVKNGLTSEQFEATRAYLSKQVNLLVKTDDSRLGYALDSKFYGTGPFAETVKQTLAKLTLADVNRAIKQHLRSDRLQFVVVTQDAEAFKNAILGADPTPITYQSKPAAEVLEEDKLIEAIRLDLKPENVKVVPADKVF